MQLPRVEEGQDAVEVPRLAIEVVLVEVWVKAVAELEDLFLRAARVIGQDHVDMTRTGRCFYIFAKQLLYKTHVFLL